LLAALTLFLLPSAGADRALGQAAATVETLRYVLLTGAGSPAGEPVVERREDGRMRVRYIFKNNGRGPDLRVHAS
jgi:hypothetical protein